MSLSRIILLQVLIILGICARLNPNDPLCNKYLEKFGTADNSDGSGASKIAFKGDASFIGATSDVQVNIKYSDVDLFNDPTYYGLVQEDGKSPETTCLDLRIYKFDSEEYKNGELVTDLAIKSSQNFSKQWRYYSFIISGNELNKRLILTQNSNYFIYKGYYGIAFYAAETDELQYTFYFQFSVTINRETSAPEETAAVSLSLTATHDCNPTGECTIASQSVLKWCSDFTCSVFTTPDLSLNDSFYLLQIITQEEMKNYYLTQTEVWYTGDGLNKKANIIQKDNSVKGQIKLQLQADIAWTKVTIQITSVLSESPNARRRLLSSQTTYDTLLAQNDIECIKDQGSQTCSTCEQECKINGFARQGCDFCSRSKLKSILLLVVLFLVSLI